MREFCGVFINYRINAKPCRQVFRTTKFKNTITFAHGKNPLRNLSTVLGERENVSVPVVATAPSKFCTGFA